MTLTAGWNCKGLARNSGSGCPESADPAGSVHSDLASAGRQWGRLRCQARRPFHRCGNGHGFVSCCRLMIEMDNAAVLNHFDNAIWSAVVIYLSCQWHNHFLYSHFQQWMPGSYWQPRMTLPRCLWQWFQRIWMQQHDCPIWPSSTLLGGCEIVLHLQIWTADCDHTLSEINSECTIFLIIIHPCLYLTPYLGSLIMYSCCTAEMIREHHLSLLDKETNQSFDQNLPVKPVLAAIRSNSIKGVLKSPAVGGPKGLTGMGQQQQSPRVGEISAIQRVVGFQRTNDR